MALKISDYIKLIGNDFASVADDGIPAGDCSQGYVDSGSFALNALLSADIFGGYPKNKLTLIGGAPASGKSFLAIGSARNFLQQNPTGIVFYFESESAISRDMLLARGLDTKRIAIIPVVTVQEFRTQALKILDNYEKQADGDRQPLMFILDSMGNLSTMKEMEDSSSGKDTRDMTRAQLLKATFRVLTLRLGRAGIPLLILNHVYANIGCMSEDVQVKTADGLKSISEIKVGDMVYALNGLQEVDHVFKPEDLSSEGKTFMELEFDDGTKVKCTGNHQFLTKDEEWVCAENLKLGDEFF